MCNSSIKKLSFLLLMLLLFSYANESLAAEELTPAFAPVDLNPMLASGEWVQRASNFTILFDNSGSMRGSFQGRDKFSIAKDIVNYINLTIPVMKLTGTLRIYGLNLATLNFSTISIYGPAEYSRSKFENALNSISDPRGGTPLERQINADIKELRGANGQIAVIIISDGEEMGNVPITSAEMMKAIYGDRICIYTIQVGADPAGRTLLEQIAKVGGCGFYIRSDHLKSNSEIADYVEKVFLTRKPSEGAKPFEPIPPPPPPSSPPPPAPPAPVVEEKKTPEIPTETEQKIIEKGRVTLMIQFDTAKAVVKPKYYDEIKKVTDVMQRHPDLHIVIEGHTDNVGGEKYNLGLSQRRANAVIKVMETRFKIDAPRLKAEGFGYSRPIASNKTAEGRQKNRRVEAAVEYTFQGKR